MSTTGDSAQATYTLESLKNAVCNLRTAFNAGFEVLCDESTIGLNEWAVSEIERLRDENENLRESVYAWEQRAIRAETKLEYPEGLK